MAGPQKLVNWIILAVDNDITFRNVKLSNKTGWTLMDTKIYEEKSDGASVEPSIRF